MRLWGLLAFGIGMAAAQADVALPNRQLAFPTGEVLADGESVWTQHDIFINTWDHGLTDRLELGTVLPDAPIIGHLGLRYRLTPRRVPWKLTIGSGVAWTLLSSARLWGGVSLTAAWARGPLAVHATALEYRARSRSDVVQLHSAGLGWRPSRSWTVSADLFWLTRARAPACASYHQVCSTRFQTGGAMVGVRLVGHGFGLEVGALVLPALDYTPLPVISFVHLS